MTERCRSRITRVALGLFALAVGTTCRGETAPGASPAGWSPLAESLRTTATQGTPTVVVVTYALWSFEVGRQTGSVWPQISLVPFTLAILRFAIDVDSGTAEEPEEIVLHDRVLLALGVLWTVSLALAVYA